jgi:hypothetical protein
MRRLRRFIATPATPLHALTPGELAAMSWLAESLTRRATLAQFGDRLLAADFEEFLADVPRGMQRIAAHLRLPGDADWLRHIGSNPALTRYSKSPDHAYSPALRAQVLQQARTEHQAEIANGLRWLGRLAEQEAQVAEVLQLDA